MTTDVQKRPATWKCWAMTIRPKPLNQPIIPILTATFLALNTGAKIQWNLVGFALVVAVLIQHASHLINDALDFKKGSDTASRIGPIRPLQRGLLTYREVYVGGIVCLALALIAGIPLMQAGGLPLFFAIATSAAMAYLYTGGPYPLAYTGLSDLFVFLFYGLCLPLSIFYVLALHLNAEALLMSSQLGFLATVMLVVVNLRDVTDDTKVAKRTLVVRFGMTFSRLELLFLALMPFALNPLWWWLGYKGAAFLPFLALPSAFFLLRGVWKNEPGPIYNKFMGIAALLHISFAFLLCIGFYI